MARKKLADIEIADDEDDDAEPNMIPEYNTLRSMYAGFDYAEGIYTTQVQRLSPAQMPDGTPARGFLNAFPRPIYELDIERIYGGGKYLCRVTGPRDPDNSESSTGWLAVSKGISIGGPTKMPPDFSGENDKPVNWRAPKGSDGEEGQGEEGDGADTLLPGDASGVNTVLLSHIMQEAKAGRAREQMLADQLQQARTKDPRDESRAEMAQMQAEAWNRQMDMQAQQQQAFNNLLAGLNKHDDGASAQHFLATIESLKAALEAAQRDGQRLLSENQQRMSDALNRAEESHREDRRFLITQYEQRERDMMARYEQRERDLQDRGTDEVKRADRKVSEIRGELNSARDRIDTLTDELSKTRMELAAAQAGGGKNSDPLRQLETTAEVFGRMKGLFGGSEGDSIASQIIGTVESGALEKTLGGVGARIASAWKGSGGAAPNPQQTAQASAAWQDYVRQQEAARRQANTGRRRRMRGQTPAQQAAQALPPEQAQAVRQAQNVAQQAAQASPEGFLMIDGRPAQVSDLPLIIQRAIEGQMPANQFALILRPAIGGPEDEAMLLGLEDSTAIAALESRAGGRLPAPSRQYMRDVLAAFRQMKAMEAAGAGPGGGEPAAAGAVPAPEEGLVEAPPEEAPVAAPEEEPAAEA